ncbi:MAG: hypothetical protein J7L34_07065 [Thermotogaceae bacterium]|nr:hypothetical protein [Thermotogaceae bacterium]
MTRSICSWKPLEDVREALVKIKKYGKIVVISSTDEDMIRASIEKNWSRF